MNLSSVVCLSPVMLHPAQTLEIFGNRPILHDSIAEGVGQFVLKYFGQKFEGVLGSHARYRGMKMAFFDHLG